MFLRRITLSLIVAASIGVPVMNSPRAQSRAQSRARVPAPAPSPTPTNADAQDDVKVFTEEVRIPVFAYDEHGRFDPTLEQDDILVVEDDVPQQVKSVRRIPASILLLLGTGGELNPAIRTGTTRSIALNLVSNLREGDQIAALQFNGRTEVIQDWTTEKERVTRALRSKLASGKGSNLSQAIARAAEQLQSRPVGNRHLVLVTDGVETTSRLDGAEATRRLIAAQATLHVISYTAIGRKSMKEQEKRPKEVAGAVQSRADMATVGIDPTRPPGMRREGINPPQVNGGIRFDPELRRRRKAYEEAMKRSEARLTSLAEETGGRILLPTSTEEMISRGSEVAREIDSQYVVTYAPKRPLATAPPAEYRQIRVNPRRSGLQLRARRGYVVSAMR